MMQPRDLERLSYYFPAPSINLVSGWIVSKKVHFRISRDRKTKLGDYRSPVGYGNHRITVNKNLNPYAFLITFVHEYAHLITWEQYGHRIKPHGKEWKFNYLHLMREVLETSSFPADVEVALVKSLRNIKASTAGEMELTRILRRYDETGPSLVLEDLAQGTHFELENGKQFEKGARRRTRYLCTNLNNRKNYLVHALTPVQKLTP